MLDAVLAWVSGLLTAALQWLVVRYAASYCTFAPEGGIAIRLGRTVSISVRRLRLAAGAIDSLDLPVGIDAIALEKLVIQIPVLWRPSAAKIEVELESLAVSASTQSQRFPDPATVKRSIFARVLALDQAAGSVLVPTRASDLPGCANVATVRDAAAAPTSALAKFISNLVYYYVANARLSIRDMRLAIEGDPAQSGLPPVLGVHVPGLRVCGRESASPSARTADAEVPLPLRACVDLEGVAVAAWTRQPARGAGGAPHTQPPAPQPDAVVHGAPWPRGTRPILSVDPTSADATYTPRDLSATALSARHGLLRIARRYATPFGAEDPSWRAAADGDGSASPTDTPAAEPGDSATGSEPPGSADPQWGAIHASVCVGRITVCAAAAGLDAASSVAGALLRASARAASATQRPASRLGHTAPGRWWRYAVARAGEVTGRVYPHRLRRDLPLRRLYRGISAELVLRAAGAHSFAPTAAMPARDALLEAQSKPGGPLATALRWGHRDADLAVLAAAADARLSEATITVCLGEAGKAGADVAGKHRGARAVAAMLHTQRVQPFAGEAIPRLRAGRMLLELLLETETCLTLRCAAWESLEDAGVEVASIEAERIRPAWQRAITHFGTGVHRAASAALLKPAAPHPAPLSPQQATTHLTPSKWTALRAARRTRAVQAAQDGPGAVPVPPPLLPALATAMPVGCDGEAGSGHDAVHKALGPLCAAACAGPQGGDAVLPWLSAREVEGAFAAQLAACRPDDSAGMTIDLTLVGLRVCLPGSGSGSGTGGESHLSLGTTRARAELVGPEQGMRLAATAASLALAPAGKEEKEGAALRIHSDAAPLPEAPSAPSCLRAVLDPGARALVTDGASLVPAETTAVEGLEGVRTVTFVPGSIGLRLGHIAATASATALGPVGAALSTVGAAMEHLPEALGAPTLGAPPPALHPRVHASCTLRACAVDAPPAPLDVGVAGLSVRMPLGQGPAQPSAAREASSANGGTAPTLCDVAQAQEEQYSGLCLRLHSVALSERLRLRSSDEPCTLYRVSVTGTALALEASGGGEVPVLAPAADLDCAVRLALGPAPERDAAQTDVSVTCPSLAAGLSAPGLDHVLYAVGPCLAGVLEAVSPPPAPSSAAPTTPEAADALLRYGRRAPGAGAALQGWLPVFVTHPHTIAPTSLRVRASVEAVSLALLLPLRAPRPAADDGARPWHATHATAATARVHGLGADVDMRAHNMVVGVRAAGATVDGGELSARAVCASGGGDTAPPPDPEAWPLLSLSPAAALPFAKDADPAWLATAAEAAAATEVREAALALTFASGPRPLFAHAPPARVDSGTAAFDALQRTPLAPEPTLLSGAFLGAEKMADAWPDQPVDATPESGRATARGRGWHLPSLFDATSATTVRLGRAAVWVDEGTLGAVMAWVGGMSACPLPADADPPLTATPEEVGDWARALAVGGRPPRASSVITVSLHTASVAAGVGASPLAHVLADGIGVQRVSESALPLPPGAGAEWGGALPLTQDAIQACRDVWMTSETRVVAQGLRVCDTTPGSSDAHRCLLERGSSPVRDVAPFLRRSAGADAKSGGGPSRLAALAAKPPMLVLVLSTLPVPRHRTANPGRDLDSARRAVSVLSGHVEDVRVSYGARFVTELVDWATQGPLAVALDPKVGSEGRLDPGPPPPAAAAAAAAPPSLADRLAFMKLDVALRHALVLVPESTAGTHALGLYLDSVSLSNYSATPAVVERNAACARSDAAAREAAAQRAQQRDAAATATPTSRRWLSANVAPRRSLSKGSEGPAARPRSSAADALKNGIVSHGVGLARREDGWAVWMDSDAEDDSRKQFVGSPALGRHDARLRRELESLLGASLPAPAADGDDDERDAFADPVWDGAWREQPPAAATEESYFVALDHVSLFTCQVAHPTASLAWHAVVAAQAATGDAQRTQSSSRWKDAANRATRKLRGLGSSFLRAVVSTPTSLVSPLWPRDSTPRGDDEEAGSGSSDSESEYASDVDDVSMMLQAASAAFSHAGEEHADRDNAESGPVTQTQPGEEEEEEEAEEEEEEEAEVLDSEALEWLEAGGGLGDSWMLPHAHQGHAPTQRSRVPADATSHLPDLCRGYAPLATLAKGAAKRVAASSAALNALPGFLTPGATAVAALHHERAFVAPPGSHSSYHTPAGLDAALFASLGAERPAGLRAMYHIRMATAKPFALDVSAHLGTETMAIAVESPDTGLELQLAPEHYHVIAALLEGNLAEEPRVVAPSAAEEPAEGEAPAAGGVLRCSVRLRRLSLALLSPTHPTPSPRRKPSTRAAQAKAAGSIDDASWHALATAAAGAQARRLASTASAKPAIAPPNGVVRGVVLATLQHVSVSLSMAGEAMDVGLACGTLSLRDVRDGFYNLRASALVTKDPVSAPWSSPTAVTDRVARVLGMWTAGGNRGASAAGGGTGGRGSERWRTLRRLSLHSPKQQQSPPEEHNASWRSWLLLADSSLHASDTVRVASLAACATHTDPICSREELRNQLCSVAARKARTLRRAGLERGSSSDKRCGPTSSQGDGDATSLFRAAHNPLPLHVVYRASGQDASVDVAADSLVLGVHDLGAINALTASLGVMFPAEEEGEGAAPAPVAVEAREEGHADSSGDAAPADTEPGAMRVKVHVTRPHIALVQDPLAQWTRAVILHTLPTGSLDLDYDSDAAGMALRLRAIELMASLEAAHRGAQASCQHVMAPQRVAETGTARPAASSSASPRSHSGPAPEAEDGVRRGLESRLAVRRPQLLAEARRVLEPTSLNLFYSSLAHLPGAEKKHPAFGGLPLTVESILVVHMPADAPTLGLPDSMVDRIGCNILALTLSPSDLVLFSAVAARFTAEEEGAEEGAKGASSSSDSDTGAVLPPAAEGEGGSGAAQSPTAQTPSPTPLDPAEAWRRPSERALPTRAPAYVSSIAAYVPQLTVRLVDDVFGLHQPIARISAKTVEFESTTEPDDGSTYREAWEQLQERLAAAQRRAASLSQELVDRARECDEMRARDVSSRKLPLVEEEGEDVGCVVMGVDEDEEGSAAVAKSTKRRSSHTSIHRLRRLHALGKFRRRASSVVSATVVEGKEEEEDDDDDDDVEEEENGSGATQATPSALAAEANRRLAAVQEGVPTVVTAPALQPSDGGAPHQTCMGVRLDLWGSFFDRSQVAWAPLIEPWTVSFLSHGSDVTGDAHILRGAKPLDINITETALGAVASLQERLTGRPAPVSASPEESEHGSLARHAFSVRNETGVPLRFCLPALLESQGVHVMGGDADEVSNARDVRMDLLRITVCGASGLNDLDDDTASDPFVRCSFRGDKRETSVVANTLSPDWNEHFDYAIPSAELLAMMHANSRGGDSGFGDDRLSLTVLDYDETSAHDQIGEATLALGSLCLAPGESMQRWVVLTSASGAYGGRVLLRVAWVVDAEKLRHRSRLQSTQPGSGPRALSAPARSPEHELRQLNETLLAAQAYLEPGESQPLYFPPTVADETVAQLGLAPLPPSARGVTRYTYKVSLQVHGLHWLPEVGVVQPGVSVYDTPMLGLEAGSSTEEESGDAGGQAPAADTAGNTHATAGGLGGDGLARLVPLACEVATDRRGGRELIVRAPLTLVNCTNSPFLVHALRGGADVLSRSGYSLEPSACRVIEPGGQYCVPLALVEAVLADLAVKAGDDADAAARSRFAVRRMLRFRAGSNGADDGPSEASEGEDENEDEVQDPTIVLRPRCPDDGLSVRFAGLPLADVVGPDSSAASSSNWIQRGRRRRASLLKGEWITSVTHSEGGESEETVRERCFTFPVSVQAQQGASPPLRRASAAWPGSGAGGVGAARAIFGDTATSDVLAGSSRKKAPTRVNISYGASAGTGASLDPPFQLCSVLQVVGKQKKAGRDKEPSEAAARRGSAGTRMAETDPMRSDSVVSTGAGAGEGQESAEGGSGDAAAALAALRANPTSASPDVCVRLLPPLVLESLLPVGLGYEVLEFGGMDDRSDAAPDRAGSEDKAADHGAADADGADAGSRRQSGGVFGGGKGALHARVVSRGHLAPLVQMEIDTVDTIKALGLRLWLPHSRSTGVVMVHFPPGVVAGRRNKVAEKAELADSLGQRVTLHLDHSRSSSLARNITIFAPVWVVNRTPYDLWVQPSSGTAAKPQLPAGSVHTGAAAQLHRLLETEGAGELVAGEDAAPEAGGGRLRTLAALADPARGSIAVGEASADRSSNASLLDASVPREAEPGAPWDTLVDSAREACVEGEWDPDAETAQLVSFPHGDSDRRVRAALLSTGGAHDATAAAVAAATEGDRVALPQMTRWSQPFSVETVGVVQTISAPAARPLPYAYELGVVVRKGHGAFRRTTVLELQPRFVIRNGLSRTLEVQQLGVPHSVHVPPRSRLPFQFPSARGKQALRVRYSSDWCWSGFFPVDESSNAALRMLPRAGGDGAGGTAAPSSPRLSALGGSSAVAASRLRSHSRTSIGSIGSSGSVGDAGSAANHLVDVYSKLSEDTAAVQLVLKPLPPLHAPYRVVNHTSAFATRYRQRSGEVHPWQVLRPGLACEYAWEEPMGPTQLLVQIGKDAAASSSRNVTGSLLASSTAVNASAWATAPTAVDLDLVGQIQAVAGPNGTTIYGRVSLEGRTRVLTLSDRLSLPQRLDAAEKELRGVRQSRETALEQLTEVERVLEHDEDELSLLFEQQQAEAAEASIIEAKAAEKAASALGKARGRVGKLRSKIRGPGRKSDRTESKDDDDDDDESEDEAGNSEDEAQAAASDEQKRRSRRGWRSKMRKGKIMGFFRRRRRRARDGESSSKSVGGETGQGVGTVASVSEGDESVTDEEGGNESEGAKAGAGDDDVASIPGGTALDRTALRVHQAVVAVRSAEDLVAADRNGYSDPYVRAWLQRGQHTSTVHKTRKRTRTLNPRWDKEVFVFDVGDVEKGHESSLVFEVYDHDHIGSDDFLGRAEVRLSEVEDQVQHDMSLPLRPRNAKDTVRGEVQVTVQWVHCASTLFKASAEAIRSQVEALVAEEEGLEADVEHLRRQIARQEGARIARNALQQQGASKRGARAASVFLRRTRPMTLPPARAAQSAAAQADGSPASTSTGSRLERQASTAGAGAPVGKVAALLERETRAWRESRRHPLAAVAGAAAAARHRALTSAGVLKCRLVAARNLPSADANGLSDPYAVMTCGGFTHRTRTVRRSLRPLWRTDPGLDATLLHSDVSLRVCVADEDLVGSDDPLGEVALTLREVQLLCANGPVRQWFALSPPTDLERGVDLDGASERWEGQHTFSSEDGKGGDDSGGGLDAVLGSGAGLWTHALAEGTRNVQWLERTHTQPIARASSALQRAPHGMVQLELAFTPTEPAGEHLSQVAVADLAGVGLSVVQASMARELCHLSLRRVAGVLWETEELQSATLVTGSLQVDNQLEGAGMPVLLAPTPKHNPPPLLHLHYALDRAQSTQDIVFYRNVQVLLQELDLRLEEQWLRVAGDFAMQSVHTLSHGGGGGGGGATAALTRARRVASRSETPWLWAREKEEEEGKGDAETAAGPSAVSPAADKSGESYELGSDAYDGFDEYGSSTASADEEDVTLSPVSVVRAGPNAVAGADGGAGAAALPPDRVFIRQLQLHPLKANVTFRSTGAEYPRTVMPEVDRDETLEWLLGLVCGFEGLLDNAPLRFNALVIDNVLQTQQHLTSRLSSHYFSQAVSQVYHVLGSLDVFGNPVSMISSLGTGVHDFFYEPYQGMAHDLDVVGLGAGLAKGTLSLVHSGVSGAATMAERISGSLGHGVAKLSMDEEYLARRARSQQQQSQRSGAARSLREAGMGLGRGVVGGMTGVITAPVMGARQGGASGFVKGVGLGLVGAVVKPTAGVFDFASHAATSIQSAAHSLVGGDRTVYPARRRRRPRVFGPGGRLVVFSPRAAEAASLTARARVVAAKGKGIGAPVFSDSIVPLRSLFGARSAAGAGADGGGDAAADALVDVLRLVPPAPTQAAWRAVVARASARAGTSAERSMHKLSLSDLSLQREVYWLVLMRQRMLVVAEDEDTGEVRPLCVAALTSVHKPTVGEGTVDSLQCLRSCPQAQVAEAAKRVAAAGTLSQADTAAPAAVLRIPIASGAPAGSVACTDEGAFLVSSGGSGGGSGSIGGGDGISGGRSHPSVIEVRTQPQASERLSIFQGLLVRTAATERCSAQSQEREVASLLAAITKAYGNARSRHSPGKRGIRGIKASMRFMAGQRGQSVRRSASAMGASALSTYVLHKIAVPWVPSADPLKESAQRKRRAAFLAAEATAKLAVASSAARTDAESSSPEADPRRPVVLASIQWEWTENCAVGGRRVAHSSNGGPARVATSLLHGQPGTLVLHHGVPTRRQSSTMSESVGLAVDGLTFGRAPLAELFLARLQVLPTGRLRLVPLAPATGESTPAAVDSARAHVRVRSRIEPLSCLSEGALAGRGAALGPGSLWLCARRAKRRRTSGGGAGTDSDGGTTPATTPRLALSAGAGSSRTGTIAGSGPAAHRERRASSARPSFFSAATQRLASKVTLGPQELCMLRICSLLQKATLRHWQLLLRSFPHAVVDVRLIQAGRGESVPPGFVAVALPTAVAREVAAAGCSEPLLCYQTAAMRTITALQWRGARAARGVGVIRRVARLFASGLRPRDIAYARALLASGDRVPMPVRAPSFWVARAPAPPCRSPSRFMLAPGLDPAVAAAFLGRAGARPHVASGYWAVLKRAEHIAGLVPYSGPVGVEAEVKSGVEKASQVEEVKEEDVESGSGADGASPALDLTSATSGSPWASAVVQGRVRARRASL